MINYSEFIAATLDVKDFLTTEKMRSIFAKFDTMDTGFISRENLVQAFGKMG